MIKICYYDNVICPQNPGEVMYPFIRKLLKWVEDNEAHLTIKTKYYPAHRPFECRKFHPAQHYKWYYFWRKIPEKDVYIDYPWDIKAKLNELETQGKLTWKKNYDDITPALSADIVIVVPEGQIIPKLTSHRKVFFFKHKHTYLNNVSCFKKDSEIIKILENKRNASEKSKI